ncbi:MAG TPA: chemotaxis response regulator protein-glutamate methylesterase [Longimicrobiales bacterium]
MIRVLIIDDSALVRKVLTETLSGYDGIEVVGTATDPYVAREKIAQLRPDVLTLDIEMPRMDGLSFLEKLMAHHPMPVVIVSSLAPEGSEAAVRALALGAIEVVSKPGSAYSTPQDARRLVEAIRAGASARIARPATGVRSAPAASRRSERRPLVTTHKVLAIGASTGGPAAIETILRALPANAPGTVIVQHMPGQFTTAFAARLNQVCAMEVREARDNDPIVPGLALIAPGGHHVVVQQNGARYSVRIKDGPPVHHQRPAVDVLFLSVARSAGRNAIGVLLTGMGADGAQGLKALRMSGARTLVQDERTSVVWGMPREAVRLDAAEEILALPQIAPAILRLLGGARVR